MKKFKKIQTATQFHVGLGMFFDALSPANEPLPHPLYSPSRREMFLSYKELGMYFSKVHFPTLKKFPEPRHLPKGRWFKDLSCDRWVTGKLM